MSGRVECKQLRGKRLEKVPGRVECKYPRGERLEVLSDLEERTHTA